MDCNPVQVQMMIDLETNLPERITITGRDYGYSVARWGGTDVENRGGEPQNKMRWMRRQTLHAEHVWRKKEEKNKKKISERPIG